jgi:hypothetical protein
MRIPLALCAATAMAAAWMPPAQAQPAAAPGQVTSGVLARFCDAAAGKAERGFCQGFLIGAGQYHVEVSRPGGLPGVFCLPTPAPSLEQAQADFVAWSGAHPQYAGEKAIDGLMRWSATYPCLPPPPPAAPTRPRARR